MRVTKRGVLAVGTALVALSASGCGSDTSYHNKLRPPAPIVVSAYISDRSVSLSPNRFGAGPITLVVTNQSGASQQLTFETTGSGAGVRQTTGPINPSDTATLKATVRPGNYQLRASTGSVLPGRLVIRGQRPSSQNDLFQP